MQSVLKHVIIQMELQSKTIQIGQIFLVTQISQSVCAAEKQHLIYAFPMAYATEVNIFGVTIAPTLPGRAQGALSYVSVTVSPLLS